MPQFAQVGLMPMSAVPQQLLGLVDPMTLSKIGSLHNAEYKQALHNVTSVLPHAAVLDLECLLLLHSRNTLKNHGRLRLVTFLWGNGIDPVTIRAVVTPLVKINRIAAINQILGTLKSGAKDNFWFYFKYKIQPIEKVLGRFGTESKKMPKMNTASLV
jgi:hypothetical protein